MSIAGVDWWELDIRHRDNVTALVQQTRPAVIINTAFQQTDWATTADGAMHVAAAAAARPTCQSAYVPGPAHQARSTCAWTAP